MRSEVNTCKNQIQTVNIFYLIFIFPLETIWAEHVIRKTLLSVSAAFLSNHC